MVICALTGDVIWHKCGLVLKRAKPPLAAPLSVPSLIPSLHKGMENGKSENKRGEIPVIICLQPQCTCRDMDVIPYHSLSG